MSSSWWDDELKIGNRTLTPFEFLSLSWKTLTDQEIAAALSKARGKLVRYGAVTNKRQNAGFSKTRTGVPIIFDAGSDIVYNNPPVIRSNNALVISDVHSPYHSAEWCSEVVYVAKTEGITHCVVAGDLFDFDALSSFAKHITVTGDDFDLSAEIESASDFIDVLLGNFDSITYTLGNHEKRLSRVAGVRVRTSLIRAVLGKRFEERIQIHPYYYCIIEDSSGARWRITHPKNSSVIPVRVAARLADKYQMHVVAAHGHDWGCTTSVSGFYAAACGACVDKDKLEYVALEDNLRPKVQQGAWMLVRGQPVLLHPKYGTKSKI